MQSGKAVHILANFHRFRGSVVSIGFRNNFYESRSSSKLPDVHNEEITSQVENPLTWILVEPSLYQQASNCRTLTVPWSPVEDRQYQMDIVGVSLAIGHWQDVEERNRKPVKPCQRTQRWSGTPSSE